MFTMFLNVWWLRSLVLLLYNPNGLWTISYCFNLHSASCSQPYYKNHELNYKKKQLLKTQEMLKQKKEEWWHKIYNQKYNSIRSPKKLKMDNISVFSFALSSPAIQVVKCSLKKYRIFSMYEIWVFLMLLLFNWIPA